jgi:hypothetical protein
MTDRELIERLLFLAQTAVDQALDLNYDDPEDYFIYRELRELKAAALAQPEPQGPPKNCWLDDEPYLCPSPCVFDDPSEVIDNCVEARYLSEKHKPKEACKYYRTTARPKPPSLKEQALLQLDTLNADLAMHGKGCDLSQIRRALEALPE